MSLAVGGRRHRKVPAELIAKVGCRPEAAGARDLINRLIGRFEHSTDAIDPLPVEPLQRR
jgi:hypothetical protein